MRYLSNSVHSLNLRWTPNSEVLVPKILQSWVGFWRCPWLVVPDLHVLLVVELVLRPLLERWLAVLLEFCLRFVSRESCLELRHLLGLNIIVLGSGRLLADMQTDWPMRPLAVVQHIV